MKRLFIISILIFFLALPAFLLAKSVSGVVFHDLNRNQKLDPGEPGIAGVMVSNQEDVVLTDENGKYKLDVTDETIIFVTKPAGWAVPLNENNIPQFYYIHQPKGSPKLSYSGIKPTGKLPKHLNFPLYKEKKKVDFKALMFGDTQSRDTTEVCYLRDDIVSEVVGTQARFVLVLGDIVFDNLNMYDFQNAILGQIGAPVYYLPGNHDENYDAQDDHYATETYKSHFGPNYYSFDYGEVHFVILDDVNYLGKDENNRVHYEGRIGDKQLKWIENDLRFVPKDKLVVFAMHIPIFYGDGANKAINVVDREKLFALLQDRKNILAVAGHMHTIDHYFLGQEAGWNGEKRFHQIVCAATCGAWWSGPKDVRGIPLSVEEDGTPNGYHIFSFRGNQYAERFKPASQPANYQLRISYPVNWISRDNLAVKKIIVNVFDGSEKSEVWYSLDGSDWQKMKQEAVKDPFFDLFYNLSGDETPSWINPRPASHTWTAPLKPDTNFVIHKLVVKTRDQFGNIYSASRIFLLK